MRIATPWALGVALLASFTADAGQEVPQGASMAPISALNAAVVPAPFAPDPLTLDADFGPHFGRGLLQEARLELGPPEMLATIPDEIEPRTDLKKGARIFPEVDRSHKGDPLIGLRPSISSRLRQKGALDRLRADILTFGQDESGLASSFSPRDGDPPGPDSVAHFEAWDADDAPVTQSGVSDASPTSGPGDMTMRPAALAERIAQGATPPVPRADALGSNTPFAADQTPVQADLSVIARGEQAAGSSSRRDYLAMIPSERLASEKHCLAQAVYFEARGESEEGQAAVAQVVLNRMTSGLYPSTICGVVFQNRSHYRACQFSFACDGHALRIREPDAWTEATQVAENVLAGKTWNADIGDATHYHANYVRPRWARSLKKMDVIGKHIFYRLGPG
ncbi:cell wall hydrolase [Rhodoblastus acidophilus]|nr:cell wall hydrolase [Candidatus Rhodoblastus alkanivorans]MDI4642139.1 cell wall hydrolase [Rhodoblastus acidophilus]